MSDERLRDAARELDVDLEFSPTVSGLAALVAAGLLAHRVGGLVLVVGATALLGAGVASLRPLFRSRRRQRFVESLPDRAVALARLLRTGVPLEVALGDVFGGGGSGAVSAAIRETTLGRPLGPVLADWAENAASEPERLLASALAVGRSLGGDISSCVDSIGESLRDEISVRRRRTAVVAQARMSARVLAAMPVLFAALSSTLRGSPTFATRTGLLLLGVGLLLDGAGLWWMHRLVGRVR